MREAVHRSGKQPARARKQAQEKPYHSPSVETSEQLGRRVHSPRSILEIQQIWGNRAVQRLLANRSEQAGIARQTAGPIIQRDSPNPEKSAAGSTGTSAEPTVQFGAMTVRTFKQLASVAIVAEGVLEDDLKDADPKSDLYTKASDWIAWVRFFIPYLESQGDKPLTQGAADNANAYLKNGEDLHVKLKAQVDEAKRLQVIDELRRARQQADEAAAEAEKLRPAYENQLKGAFREGKESLIKEWADRIGTTTDISMGLHELARQMSEEIASAVGTELPALTKFTESLNYFNKGLAALNLFFIVTDHDKKTTELEDGMRQINNAAGAFAAFSTLTNLAPHIGLYANLYLVPATKIIMAQISHLTEQLQDANNDWVEFTGDIMYPAAEPGGQEMFDFMKAVMHAGSAKDIPEIRGKVKDFLYDHRDELEAGTGEEVPTSGRWFWQKLDTDEAGAWVFNHRRMIWAMLYGTRKVPEAKK